MPGPYAANDAALSVSPEQADLGQDTANSDLSHATVVSLYFIVFRYSKYVQYRFQQESRLHHH